MLKAIIAKANKVNAIFNSENISYCRENNLKSKDDSNSIITAIKNKLEL